MSNHCYIIRTPLGGQQRFDNHLEALTIARNNRAIVYCGGNVIANYLPKEQS